MMEVKCGMGLGNRVTAMANGLSRSPRISFVWRVNRHCPVSYRELWPVGVPGVEFVDGEGIPLSVSTAWDGMWCYQWGAAADRQAANAAYGRILASMRVREHLEAPPVAVCGRFHRNPSGQIGRLAAAVVDTGQGRVFVLSDRYRSELSGMLDAAGVSVVMASSGPLDEDLSRAPSDVLAYAGDWRTLLRAELIVALDGPASALHPARAAGIPIRYV